MQTPSFDSVKRLAAKLALRVQRRLHSFGVRHIEMDDLMQEAYVAYVLATRSWDSSRGVPFSLYFARGLQQHLNRFVEREERVFAVGGVSLTDHDAPDEADSPEDLVLMQQRGAHALSALSANARKMLELLHNPPPFLFQQVEAIQERARYARTFCRNSVVASEITLGLIADFIGLSRYERRQLYREINHLAEKVSQS